MKRIVALALTAVTLMLTAGSADAERRRFRDRDRGDRVYVERQQSLAPTVGILGVLLLSQMLSQQSREPSFKEQPYVHGDPYPPQRSFK